QLDQQEVPAALGRQVVLDPRPHPLPPGLHEAPDGALQRRPVLADRGAGWLVTGGHGLAPRGWAPRPGIPRPRSARAPAGDTCAGAAAAPPARGGPAGVRPAAGNPGAGLRPDPVR